MILCHAHVTGFAGGNLGVTVFFTLSGYLITRLLLEELAATGRIDLPGFWRRRALRLLPALLAFVAGCAVLLPLLPEATPSGVLPTLLYFSNWTRATGGDIGAFSHTWSLAVEEQFYLVWPLVVAVCWRWLTWQRLVAVAAGIMLVREVLAGSWSFVRIETGFDLRADALLVGCALAFAVHAGWRAPAWFGQVGVGALAVALFAHQLGLDLSWMRHSLAAVATCAVIASPTAIRALAARPLVWFGRRSYGAYLWHYPLALIILGDDHSLTRVAMLLAVTLAVTAASYRYIEEPFLKLKRQVVSIQPEIIR